MAGNHLGKAIAGGAEWATGDALFETYQRDAGVERWIIRGVHADFREVVSD